MSPGEAGTVARRQFPVASLKNVTEGWDILVNVAS
jgi:hypothetical protein